VTTEVLATEPELRALAPEWRALAEPTGNACVTPEWLFAAAGAYGDESAPWVPVVRNEAGALIGLMPLARGRGQRRSIHFAGASVGDLFGPVAARPEDEATVAAAVAALLRSDRAWGSLLLENVPAEAAWPEALAERPLRASALPHRDEVLPAIPLTGRTWEDYLAGRSRNFRSQIGRKLRGLEREGTVGFRLSADPTELASDLETFFTLHEARWDPRGGSAALTDRSREFHRLFAPAALERGWLRLWLMELDGEPIAAWYGWLLGGRYSYYLAGFGDRWARYSIGQLILAHTIEAAFTEGAAVYDLLLGGEDYKTRFAETSRAVHTVAVTRAFSRARVVLTAEKASRRAIDGLSPEMRERVKRPLRAVTGRLPSRMER
jgi:CelD/BcsL family acetyltransferase involved in cellulose biosynthesis